MTEFVRGPVPMVVAGLVMAASTLHTSALGAIAAGACLLAALIAARWQDSAAATVAVLAAGVALAVGEPSPARGCATGLLALAFLMTAEARRTLASHADPLSWLRRRSRLLLGGLGGVLAALAGGLWSLGSAWLAVAGVLASGAAYLLSVRPLADRPPPRRNP
ncbi:hypothetical protein DMP23_19745 [Amycolatopsis sp. A1MSW2902]|uniref:hypothetical protein n=1 Tax=Amycolatopsis sp. A1MSW2902 TaxID=687413 RepID=UPI00307E0839